jgi:hypothetical protein
MLDAAGHGGMQEFEERATRDGDLINPGNRGSPMPALTQDNVLLWLHGRRLGLVGDGSFSASTGVLVDGQLIGSKRGPVVSQLAAGNNGVGSVGFSAAVDGDSVLLALDLTTPANVTSSFEGVISVAGQIRQTSSANLSGKNILFQIAPAS